MNEKVTTKKTKYINQFTPSTTEAVIPPIEAEPGRLRVALLPIESTSDSAGSNPEPFRALIEQANRAINSTPALVLVESDQIQGSKLLVVDRVWNRLSQHKSKPNLNFIYSQGTQAGLDAVVMISFSSDFMGYMSYNDAELYVIDLRRRQVLDASVPRQVDALVIEGKLQDMLERTVAAAKPKDAAEVSQ